MLIITGTGRSGTASLARLLGGHHEFRVSYILDKYFLPAEPHHDPFEGLSARASVIMDLHQGVDAATFVDASNLYVHFIDVLYLLHPSVKVILAVRDGRDFVRSAISRRWHEMVSFGTVPLSGDPCLEQWPAMNPLQRASWIWTWRNRRALRGLDLIPPAQKYVLRIEDLEKDRTLRQLESFSGIRIADAGLARERVNANPSFSFPAKEDWTSEQVRQFWDIAGDVMKYFRYG